MTRRPRRPEVANDFTQSAPAPGMINAHELVEWEAITNAATAGEWRQGNVEKYHVFCSADDPDMLAPGLGRVLLNMNTHFPYEADAKFIATAKSAMPRLIRQAKIAGNVIFAMCTGQELELIQKLTKLDEIQTRLDRAEAELETYRLHGAGPFEKRAGDRLADEVSALVRRKVIDSRSPAADALLDYREPPYSERSDRLAQLDAKLEATQQRLRDLIAITDQFCHGSADEVAKATAEYHQKRPSLVPTPAPLGEPKTTDYCATCGESPESASHLFDHTFVDPRKG